PPARAVLVEPHSLAQPGFASGIQQGWPGRLSHGAAPFREESRTATRGAAAAPQAAWIASSMAQRMSHLRAKAATAWSCKSTEEQCVKVIRNASSESLRAWVSRARKYSRPHPGTHE